MLSYVVIKTNLPQIYAECQALEELIHEGLVLEELIYKSGLSAVNSNEK